MPTVEQAQRWYPADDPVHGFDHVLRVYRLAERIAIAEGADMEIVRAAALLHDAAPESSEEQERAAHHHVSADHAAILLTEEGWPQDRIAAVQHCILAHRFRDDSEQPSTLEARVLFDADKLDAIGAVGVARAVAYAARAGQPFYARPSDKFIQSGDVEAGEPHSAYHELVFKLARLKDRMFTETGRQIAEARHRFMVDFFDRLEAEVLAQK